jgi:hypothetical protein
MALLVNCEEFTIAENEWAEYGSCHSASDGDLGINPRSRIAGPTPLAPYFTPLFEYERRCQNPRVTLLRQPYRMTYLPR